MDDQIPWPTRETWSSLTLSQKLSFVDALLDDTLSQEAYNNIPHESDDDDDDDDSSKNDPLPLAQHPDLDSWQVQDAGTTTPPSSPSEPIDQPSSPVGMISLPGPQDFKFNCSFNVARSRCSDGSRSPGDALPIDHALSKEGSNVWFVPRTRRGHAREPGAGGRVGTSSRIGSLRSRYRDREQQDLLKKQLMTAMQRQTELSVALWGMHAGSAKL